MDKTNHDAENVQYKLQKFAYEKDFTEPIIHDCISEEHAP